MEEEGQQAEGRKLQTAKLALVKSTNRNLYGEITASQ